MCRVHLNVVPLHSERAEAAVLNRVNEGGVGESCREQWGEVYLRYLWKCQGANKTAGTIKDRYHGLESALTFDLGATGQSSKCDYFSAYWKMQQETNLFVSTGTLL